MTKTNEINTGLTTDGNVLIADMSILINVPNQEHEISKVIVDYATENADDLYGLRYPNLITQFKNMPKLIDVDNMPDDMTGKQLKEHNELYERAQEIAKFMNDKSQFISFEITDSMITKAMRKFYPEFNQADIDNVYAYTHDAFRTDGEWVQHIADAANLVSATKKGEPIFK